MAAFHRFDTVRDRGMLHIIAVKHITNAKVTATTTKIEWILYINAIYSGLVESRIGPEQIFIVTVGELVSWN